MFNDLIGFCGPLLLNKLIRFLQQGLHSSNSSTNDSSHLIPIFCFITHFIVLLVFLYTCRVLTCSLLHIDTINNNKYCLTECDKRSELQLLLSYNSVLIGDILVVDIAFATFFLLSGSGSLDGYVLAISLGLVSVVK